MIYYLVKYRKIVVFFLFWIIFPILLLPIIYLCSSNLDEVIVTTILMYIISFIFAIGFCVIIGDKIYDYTFKNIKKILIRYNSKPKYFIYFYNIVHQNIINVNTSIIDEYFDLLNYKGRDYPQLYNTISRFNVFLKSYPVSSSYEAIKNLDIYYLLKKHLTLLYSFYNDYSALDDKCKKLVETKEEELDKILKERMSVEFVSKTKTAKMLGYCEE